MDNKIKKLQSEDPLLIAEKITGKSYKEDERTSMLGMALHIQKGEVMEKLMDAADDTKFSETTEEYIRKITDFGFVKLYQEEFLAKGWGDGEVIGERLYIFWHEKYSILLSFDTFRGSRNGGKMYYNWSPNDIYDRYSYTSSGSFRGLYWKSDFSEEIPYEEECPRWDTKNQTWEEYEVIEDQWRGRNEAYKKKHSLKSVWSGDHDCREAIKNNINLMVENGEFITQWKSQPFLWLIHHGDTKEEGYSYEAINKERLSKLPEDVRKKILA